MTADPIIKADTGLGTTYERLAVNRLLVALQRRYRFRAVLEGPTDGIKGIAGINSLVLGRMGAAVTVQLDREEQAHYAWQIWRRHGLEDRVTFKVDPRRQLDGYSTGFDLVWNFNSIPQVESYVATVGRMMALATRCVLIMVSNSLNYGFPLHRLHHRVVGEPWHHGNIAAMKRRNLIPLFQEGPFRLAAYGYVDVPWWPDIDVPYGELIGAFLPFLRSRLQSTAHARFYHFDADGIPYLARAAEMSRLYRKHSFIERRRWRVIQRLFAHHQFFLAERVG